MYLFHVYRDFLGAGGSLSLLQPPPIRSQGNQILINSSSSSINSNNVYAMDCEPSIINISSNQQQPSLNINQQRYLQHMHNRTNRYNNVMAPSLTLGGGGGSYISHQKFAPASLPLDLITVATAAAANNGNGSSSSGSIMVLPSTATQDHLNSSSLIINHPAAMAAAAGGFAPFNNHESTSIHHQNLPKIGTGSSRSNNSNTNNNNSASNDEMVGVCVQQSPVVIH